MSAKCIEFPLIVYDSFDVLSGLAGGKLRNCRLLEQPPKYFSIAILQGYGDSRIK